MQYGPRRCVGNRRALSADAVERREWNRCRHGAPFSANRDWRLLLNARIRTTLLIVVVELAEVGMELV